MRDRDIPSVKATSTYDSLLGEIRERIRSAQYEALRVVNKELIALYWDTGHMIVERQKVEGWGKSVVQRLAADLQKDFPGMQGFSAQNLWYMRQLYLEYSGKPKLQPLVGEISWSKNLVIMASCKDDLEREFYIRMTKEFGWTKSVLIHQIENQSYEKTLLGQTNSDKTVPKHIRAQAKLAVKDEYTFDFLELTWVRRGSPRTSCRPRDLASSRGHNLPKVSNGQGEYIFAERVHFTAGVDNEARPAIEFRISIPESL